MVTLGIINARVVVKRFRLLSQKCLQGFAISAFAPGTLSQDFVQIQGD